MPNLKNLPNNIFNKLSNNKKAVLATTSKNLKNKINYTNPYFNKRYNEISKKTKKIFELKQNALKELTNKVTKEKNTVKKLYSNPKKKQEKLRELVRDEHDKFKKYDAMLNKFHKIRDNAQKTKNSRQHWKKYTNTPNKLNISHQTLGEILHQHSSLRNLSTHKLSRTSKKWQKKINNNPKLARQKIHEMHTINIQPTMAEGQQYDNFASQQTAISKLSEKHNFHKFH